MKVLEQVNVTGTITARLINAGIENTSISYSGLTDKVICMTLPYGASPKRLARKHGWRAVRVAAKKMNIVI